MDSTHAHSRPNFGRLLCFGILFLSATGGLYGQGGGAGGNGLPAGDGRDLVAVVCGQCHGVRTVTLLRDGPAGWKKTVDEMTLRGAQIQPQEMDKVIQYLSQNFGPGAGPMQSGLSGAVLPAGPGQQLVQSHCTICHDAGRITGVQRSKEEWDGTVKNMMARVPNMAAPQDIQAMVSYLTAQFGKKAD
jgi:mono/diheme cytochrome c family protein